MSSPVCCVSGTNRVLHELQSHATLVRLYLLHAHELRGNDNDYIFNDKERPGGDERRAGGQGERLTRGSKATVSRRLPPLSQTAGPRQRLMQRATAVERATVNDRGDSRNVFRVGF
jgi:hypothetical protein